MKSRLRNAVHIKQQRHPRIEQAADLPCGPGFTMLRVFGKNEKIVESVALVERQDHTMANNIKEVVLVTVQERTGAS